MSASGEIQSPSFCRRVADAFTKEAIITRHNEWNDWTVENCCCCLGDTKFLEITDKSSWWGTALKIAALFLLSHVFGPLCSAIKSCWTWATDKMGEKCIELDHAKEDPASTPAKTDDVGATVLNKGTLENAST